VRKCIFWVATLCVFVVVGGPGTASAAPSGHAVFYLALAPGQCAIQTLGSKTFQVVPCSDSRHNFEVYAIGRGGWGHGEIPSIAGPHALALCQSAYRRITGHLLAATSGMTAFWPDPGREQASYGDKVICGYRHWPTLIPLGSGNHVHKPSGGAYTA
jgi:hypothetical protein